MLLFAAVWLFVGCNDFLDKSPDSELDVDINSEAKIAELLTGAYPEASYIPFLDRQCGRARQWCAFAVERIDLLLGRL